MSLFGVIIHRSNSAYVPLRVSGLERNTSQGAEKNSLENSRQLP